MNFKKSFPKNANIVDKPIKYIFSDIDGTLTELEKGALNLRTIAYLRHLKSKGLEIVLVSGRGEAETFFLSRDLGLLDSKKNIGYIAENGGVICSFDSEKRLVRSFISDKVQIWEDLRKTLEYTDFQILRKYSMYEKNRISDIIISKECPILKNESLLSAIKKINLVFTDSGSPDVHLHRKTVTKGEGIKQYILKKFSMEPNFSLKKYLEVSAYCGNADNDIEAALAVKYSIAVHNASEGMIKVCDYHSPKLNGEGVIDGLKHYIEPSEDLTLQELNSVSTNIFSEDSK